MNKCSVQIVSRLDSQSKFQMFELFPGRRVPGVPRRYTNMAAPYWSLPGRPPDRLALVHHEIRMRSPLCVEHNNILNSKESLR